MSGSWHLCEAAVEAILRGQPITPVCSDDELAAGRVSVSSRLKACDIRHVERRESSDGSDRLRKVQSRSRFKRSASKRKTKMEVELETESITVGDSGQLVLSGPPASHGSEETRRLSRGSDSGEVNSGSVETVSASLKPKLDDRAGLIQVDLELTLGFGL